MSKNFLQFIPKLQCAKYRTRTDNPALFIVPLSLWAI